MRDMEKTSYSYLRCECVCVCVVYINLLKLFKEMTLYRTSVIIVYSSLDSMWELTFYTVINCIMILFFL